MEDGLRVALVAHPRVQLGPHLREASRLDRLGSQVALLERVARQVVELVAGPLAVAPEDRRRVRIARGSGPLP